MKKFNLNPTVEEINKYGKALDDRCLLLTKASAIDNNNDARVFVEFQQIFKYTIIDNLVKKSKKHKKKACLVWKNLENLGTYSYPWRCYRFDILPNKVEKETPCYIWVNNQKIPKKEIFGYCNIPLEF